MDTLLQLMESYGYVALFFAMVAENANIPIPSEVVLGFAGFLISQHIFEFWTTFIVACTAGVVGSIISYWLGSYGGRPLLLKYGKYIFFNERKFNMAEKMFNTYGGMAVLICRCLPGVRTFISFPAGVARYPFWRFVLFTIIGTIPWTLLLVWAGTVLGSHWRDLIQYNHIFLIAIIAVCIIIAAVFFWRRARRRHV
ncbi:alkaline phosphatase [Megasphaera cerevisiae DSM 20462]|jgi:membrane protein DedA with SNARE-associated domain|uniref:Alkaline phosphatase n=1 Tax=Megasphaera cerevisiae DSM 20462 TaxID=1122219 RepID=A0A0J6WW60_9FIRM|nr:DedA family protein [Megasphaera cerevisiae]KMO86022.1 alkaline phosphatase [Megasphaera cerevisiae DSM 20462]SKA05760.1 membrane protein DedA, SNARE-associated domain [Megasphaera cerevisiae DSM 20462]